METTHNINNTFGLWTASKCTVQWLFKKFCKGDENLEDKCSGQPLEVDNGQLRAISEADPLTTTWEFVKELDVDHSTAIQHLKQIGKVKKLKNGCLMSWPQIKKIVVSKCHFSYSMQQQWTISWSGVWPAMKSGFLYNWWWPAQWLDLEEALKHFPKPDLHKKRSWSLFGGLLLVWSTTAFLVKPLHLRSMLSKSMRCTENCTVCSWHWSTERAQFSSMTMPNCTSHKHCFQNWMNWAMKFCLISHIHLTFHQLTIPLTQASQQLFAGKTLPQTAGSIKRFPSVHQIQKHGFLCYRNKTTYILLAKMCLL